MSKTVRRENKQTDMQSDIVKQIWSALSDIYKQKWRQLNPNYCRAGACELRRDSSRIHRCSTSKTRSRRRRSCAGAEGQLWRQSGRAVSRREYSSRDSPSSLPFVSPTPAMCLYCRCLRTSRIAARPSAPCIFSSTMSISK
jgi:hypothetical protein